MRSGLALLGLLAATGCGGCAPDQPTPVDAGRPGTGFADQPWWCVFVRCEDAGTILKTSECDAKVCPGCCEPDGTCRTGMTPLACGRNGAPCQECAPSDRCDAVAGRCVLAPVRCGPATCPGCCTIDGECVDGSANEACGSNGASCGRCDLDKVCANSGCERRCTPATCAGCCASTGECLPGLDPGACGRGATACVKCPPGNECNENQLCQAPSRCSTCVVGECCLNGSCVHATASICPQAASPLFECRTCITPDACGGGTERSYCVRPGVGSTGSRCTWDGDCAAAPSALPTCVRAPGSVFGVCGSACPLGACGPSERCVPTRLGAFCLLTCATEGAACNGSPDVVCASTSGGLSCLPRCSATSSLVCDATRCEQGRCCGEPGQPCCAQAPECLGVDGGTRTCVAGRCPQ